MLKQKKIGIMNLFVWIMLTFTFTGCGDLDEKGLLDGTWISEDESQMRIFSGSNFILKEKSGSTYVNVQKGTFSVNNGIFTQESTHEWENYSWAENTFQLGKCDIIIYDDRFTLTNNGGTGWTDTSNWSVTFVKQ